MEWHIDDGVAARWQAAGLDDVFRAHWTSASRPDQFEPLCNEEARPETPFPYCVYQRMTGLPISRDTGEAPNRMNQIEDVIIQFRVHAKSVGSDPGDRIAKDLAQSVANAFDPLADLLDFGPVGHVNTKRDGSVTLRNGDEEWVVVLPYSLTIDICFKNSFVPSEG